MQIFKSGTDHLSSSPGMSSLVAKLFVILTLVIVLLIGISFLTSNRDNLVFGFNETIDKVSNVFESRKQQFLASDKSYSETVWSQANQWWACVAPKKRVENFWKGDIDCGLERVSTHPPGVFCPMERLGVEDKINRDYKMTEVKGDNILVLKDGYKSYWQGNEKDWTKLTRGPVCLSTALAVVSHPTFEAVFRTSGKDPENKHVRDVVGNLTKFYQQCSGGNSGKQLQLCALEKLNKRFDLVRDLGD